MTMRFTLLCLVMLCSPGLALDIPFVYGNDNDLAVYSPAQLEKASSSSADLVGVPPVTLPKENEILLIPVTGGGRTSEGKLEKKAGDLEDELNRKVEPDDRIREDAEILASKYPGDLRIEQICEIYIYLKYGDISKSGWRYVRDTRGIDSWNYANESLEIGDKINCVGLGDCDDFAILMSAFVESIGGTTRIILANNNSIGGHAYAEVYLGSLDDPNRQVETIIEWLQEEYGANKIYGHMDTDTKEAWLNLDWGIDETGSAHPGGPLFQGDKHYVLRIRDEYKLIPLRMAEAVNRPPRIISLTSDKGSPQEAGAAITWKVRANDLESDQIMYRFFLNGYSATNWQKDNSWIWTTSDADIGDNKIEAYVIDRKHAGPNRFDSNKATNFSIKESREAYPEIIPEHSKTEAVNESPRVISLTSDKGSPQDIETVVTWHAEASDPESDSLLYRFLLDGETVSDWNSTSSWSWTTASRDIGQNQIEVQVRDGKHASSEDFDDRESLSFVVTRRSILPAVQSKINMTPLSEEIYGTGNIKKDYYILNKAMDYSKVSIDIKNAAYYEYKYSTYSNEIQSKADLNLIVKQADIIVCSGIGQNRNNIPTNVTTSIENGSLEYNVSVIASNKGGEASQRIIKANGDNIQAAGSSLGENNSKLENSINAYHSERFEGIQRISIGEDATTYTRIDALTGPLNAISSITAGDHILNAIAKVSSGASVIRQSVNHTDVTQNFNGIIGGADFNASVETPIGKRTKVYAVTGSGNITTLSQQASDKNAYYEMEYAYLPVVYETLGYSTPVYDFAYALSGSEVNYDKISASSLLADHCENLQAIHKTDIRKNDMAYTKVNAIAGPLNVTSYVVTKDGTLKAIADIAAGVVSIDQFLSQFEALQKSKGVICGGTYDTMSAIFNNINTRAFSVIGSGNLINLTQLTSWENAHYGVEYVYMPASYWNRTYDLDLNASKIETAMPT